MTCACGNDVFVKKTGECKTCYHRRYAREHRDEIAERRRLAYVQKPRPEPLSLEERRARERASAARYRAEHPDEVREAKRRWRTRNPEAYQAERERYRLKHRDEINARARERDRAARAPKPDLRSREERGLPSW